MSEIVKQSLCCNGKAMVVCHTDEENYSKELDNILEQMEEDNYVQCMSTPEEMAEWDKKYLDWILVADAEDDNDRILIYVK